MSRVSCDISRDVCEALRLLLGASKDGGRLAASSAVQKVRIEMQVDQYDSCAHRLVDGYGERRSYGSRSEIANHTGPQ
jgi:hypothetical protein